MRNSVQIVLAAISSVASCPVCRHDAHRVHSRYLRHLADLPAHGRPVTLAVRCRRFFCKRPDCRRKIFSERFDGFAQAFARQTVRLGDMLGQIGLVLGAEGGARLAEKLGMSTSPSTLLRVIRRIPQGAVVTPRVLGVDEWAKRKGRSYGTILCDLERRQVVDLLPEATTQVFAAWLRAHPGVEIISRDRAGTFAEGAKVGAPDAIQVADRWHLLRNLGDAVVSFLDRHRHKLPPSSLVDSSGPPKDLRALDQGGEKVPTRTQPSAREHERQHRRARRLERYEAVVKLAEQGVRVRAIGRNLGLGRKTVQKYVDAGSFPEFAPRPKRASILDPFRPYLLQRWQEGCRNAWQLFRELKDLGYGGGRPIVADAITELRRQRERERADVRVVLREGQSVPGQRVTLRKELMWFVKEPDDLAPDERSGLAQFRQACPEAQDMYDLAQTFGRMVRERRRDALPGWLDEALNGPREMRGFAKGIERDYDAVQMALQSQWSNGQTEGQIHRLKLIKRAMYGRGNLDLLSRRVLAAA